MTSRHAKHLALAWRTILLFGGLLASTPSLPGQVPQITHFVAPQYPPLARRTTVSGQVVLKATVGPAGAITRIAEESSANPLLSQSATAAVREWTFSQHRSEWVVTVKIIFGFTGKTRESDPIMTVAADFGDLAVRVYITTDSYPMGHASDETGRRG